MRKLVLQMNLSADGFAGNEQGSMDWMTASMDPEQLRVLTGLTNGMDTIIMGRKMAAGFSRYWEDVVDNQRDSPEFPYAQIFVDTPKIIFSKNIQQLEGRNVQVNNGDLAEEVGKLKQQPGRNIIVYGGAGFVSALIGLKLIDELHLFVHPVALGSGLRIFNDRTALTLVHGIVGGNGVLINHYTLAQKQEL